MSTWLVTEVVFGVKLSPEELKWARVSPDKFNPSNGALRWRCNHDYDEENEVEIRGDSVLYVELFDADSSDNHEYQDLDTTIQPQWDEWFKTALEELGLPFKQPKLMIKTYISW